MRDGWRAAVLGDVVYVDIERESVSPEKEYSIAGVRNAGQGMFGRGVLQGTATNYQILHRLRLDQVVMRKLTAWEGPVTVVPPEFDGFYVSTEFPTFTIDHELILPEFVDLLCQRPSFWQALKDRSIGTVQRRKRVSPSAFLTVPILLPPLTEQRRIVDLIRAVTAVSNAEQEADAASVVETALLRQVETLGPRLVDLAEVVTVAKSGGTPRRSNTAYFGGGIPWLKSGEVDQDYISATHESLTEAGLAASSAWLMPPRSIVVAMYGQGLTAGSVGFTALAMATNQAVLGLVPNGTKINPRFLYHWLRHRKDSMRARRAGSTQPNLNKETILREPVPALPRSSQDNIAAVLDTLSAVASAASMVQTAAEGARAALLESLFTGQHALPPSYDKFLEKGG